MPAAERPPTTIVIFAVGAFLGVVGFLMGRATTPSPHPAPPPVVAPPAPCPPAVAGPAASAPPVAPRDLGTPPWRAVGLRLDRWGDKQGWAARLYVTIERLRAAPAGTEVAMRLACLVGDAHYVDAGGMGVSDGPLHDGDRVTAWADKFFWNPVPAVPDRCDAMVYVQMPGASPDVVDHDVGHFCITPTGDTFDVAVGACLE